MDYSPARDSGPVFGEVMRTNCQVGHAHVHVAKLKAAGCPMAMAVTADDTAGAGRMLHAVLSCPILNVPVPGRIPCCK